MTTTTITSNTNLLDLDSKKVLPNLNEIIEARRLEYECRGFDKKIRIDWELYHKTVELKLLSKVND